jgi:hypothetical protein
MEDDLVIELDLTGNGSACRLCGRWRPLHRCPECGVEPTTCDTCFHVKGGALLCADCEDGYERASREYDQWLREMRANDD